MDTCELTASETLHEEWRPVVGFEGLYEVSDQGRVRRLWPSRDRRAGSFLRPGRKRGYCGVSLCRDGFVTQRAVHSLVAEAFIGPCPDRHEIGHEDNNRANNRVDNLAYVTHAQNMQHCARSTGHTRGTRNVSAKTTEAQVVRIKELLSVGGTGMPPGLIAVCVGVSIHVVYQIQSGRLWRHVVIPARRN